MCVCYILGYMCIYICLLHYQEAEIEQQFYSLSNILTAEPYLLVGISTKNVPRAYDFTKFSFHQCINLIMLFGCTQKIFNSTRKNELTIATSGVQWPHRSVKREQVVTK